jgi:hypothetical protein
VLEQKFQVYECLVNFDLTPSPALLLQQFSQKHLNLFSQASPFSSPSASSSPPGSPREMHDFQVASKQKEFEQFLSRMNMFPPKTGSYDLDTLVEIFSDEARHRERTEIFVALGVLGFSQKQTFRQAMSELAAERQAAKAKALLEQPQHMLERIAEGSATMYHKVIDDLLDSVKVRIIIF